MTKALSRRPTPSARPAEPFTFAWSEGLLASFLAGSVTALIFGMVSFNWVGWSGFAVSFSLAFPLWLSVIYQSDRAAHARELPLGSQEALTILEEAQTVYRNIHRFSRLEGLKEDAVVKTCLLTARHTLLSIKRSLILLEGLRANEAAKGAHLDVETHMEALKRELSAFRAVSLELDEYIYSRYDISLPRPGAAGILDMTKLSLTQLHTLESRVMYARQLSDSLVTPAPLTPLEEEAIRVEKASIAFDAITRALGEAPENEDESEAEDAPITRSAEISLLF